MKLLFFDLDETVLRSDPSVAHLRRRVDDGEWVRVSDAEYAAEIDEVGSNVEYDFSDFYDDRTMYRSITTAESIVVNLKVLDDYVTDGYVAAFLTARACETTTKEAVATWLMIRFGRGEISSDPRVFFSADESKAVNDVKYDLEWSDSSDAEKKAEVVRRAAQRFEEVVFFDDSVRNIEAVRSLALPNVTAIKSGLN